MATTCSAIDDEGALDTTVRQMARPVPAAAHDIAAGRASKPRKEPRAPPSADLMAIYALLAGHTPRSDHIDPALCRFVALLPAMQHSTDPCLVPQAIVVATYLMREDAAMSLRSNGKRAGRTISACRAVAVHMLSFTMTVCGRRNACASRLRS